ncbi:hypothetical protein AVEN_113484-1 [Araneus ventricosus]|uniref:Uncharacterized protein n=1 Tax=Araneus ventricosus TaxID=182803 RepID=A0A4Y2LX24_ARAVE|nr:hypothetical protein AVEN_113484-1 [Araneus ventricosus]
MPTIPASPMWSRRKIKETFNVSDYSVRKGSKTLQKTRLLKQPLKKWETVESWDIIELVKKVLFSLMNSLEFCWDEGWENSIDYYLEHAFLWIRHVQQGESWHCCKLVSPMNIGKKLCLLILCRRIS